MVLNLTKEEFDTVSNAVDDYGFVMYDTACPFHAKNNSNSEPEFFCDECHRYKEIAEDKLRSKLGLRPNHSKSSKKKPRKVMKRINGEGNLNDYK